MGVREDLLEVVDWEFDRIVGFRIGINCKHVSDVFRLALRLAKRLNEVFSIGFGGGD